MAFYKEVFDARGALYNRAMAMCPAAREAERALLIDDLGLSPGDIVVDAPAGGGYLAEALNALGSEVICLEPSPQFAAAIGRRFTTHISDIHRMPLADRSVDKVASLAGLHHLPAADLRQFFNESSRVLKLGGRLAVADVMTDTPVARFLNGFVDQHTETGHDGAFFLPDQMHDLLTKSGFVDIVVQHRQFGWVFPDHPTMLGFFRSLCGLVKASLEQIDDVIQSELGVIHRDGEVLVSWSLLYGFGDIPQ